MATLVPVPLGKEQSIPLWFSANNCSHATLSLFCIMYIPFNSRKASSPAPCMCIMYSSFLHKSRANVLNVFDVLGTSYTGIPNPFYCSLYDFQAGKGPPPPTASQVPLYSVPRCCISSSGLQMTINYTIYTVYDGVHDFLAPKAYS